MSPRQARLTATASQTPLTQQLAVLLTLMWHAKGIGHALGNRNMSHYTLPLYRSLCGISFAEINTNHCRTVPSRHSLDNARPCVCWSLKFFPMLWKKKRKKGNSVLVAAWPRQSLGGAGRGNNGCVGCVVLI